MTSTSRSTGGHPRTRQCRAVLATALVGVLLAVALRVKSHRASARTLIDGGSGTRVASRSGVGFTVRRAATTDERAAAYGRCGVSNHRLGRRYRLSGGDRLG